MLQEVRARLLRQAVATTKTAAAGAPTAASTPWGSQDDASSPRHRYGLVSCARWFTLQAPARGRASERDRHASCSPTSRALPSSSRTCRDRPRPAEDPARHARPCRRRRDGHAGRRLSRSRGRAAPSREQCALRAPSKRTSGRKACRSACGWACTRGEPAVGEGYVGLDVVRAARSAPPGTVGRSSSRTRRARYSAASSRARRSATSHAEAEYLEEERIYELARSGGAVPRAQGGAAHAGQPCRDPRRGLRRRIQDYVSSKLEGVLRSPARCPPRPRPRRRRLRRQGAALDRSSPPLSRLCPYCRRSDRGPSYLLTSGRAHDRHESRDAEGEQECRAWACPRTLPARVAEQGAVRRPIARCKRDVRDEARQPWRPTSPEVNGACEPRDDEDVASSLLDGSGAVPVESLARPLSAEEAFDDRIAQPPAQRNTTVCHRRTRRAPP